MHDLKRKDANALYARLLIDVEMSPCMMTSRIKQAISAVQLFVQRCLMNLEKDVALSTDAALEWKWRKNYRVWEASRKVFLYPENWIEPELRDDMVISMDHSAAASVIVFEFQRRNRFSPPRGVPS